MIDTLIRASYFMLGAGVMFVIIFIYKHVHLDRSHVIEEKLDKILKNQEGK